MEDDRKRWTASSRSAALGVIRCKTTVEKACRAYDRSPTVVSLNVNVGGDMIDSEADHLQVAVSHCRGKKIGGPPLKSFLIPPGFQCAPDTHA